MQIGHGQRIEQYTPSAVRKCPLKSDAVAIAAAASESRQELAYTRVQSDVQEARWAERDMGNASGRMDGSEPDDDRREPETLSGLRWPS